jgi:hypothetical protein
MRLSKIISDAVDDASYKTANGMIDLSDPYHHYLVAESLKEFLDPDVIEAALFGEKEDDQDKSFPAVKVETGNVSSFDTEDARKKAIDNGTHAEVGSAKAKKAQANAGGKKQDAETPEAEPDTAIDLSQDETDALVAEVDNEISVAQKIDRTKQANLKKELHPVLKSISKKIEKLIDAGKKDEAKALAQKLVDDLGLQQALYLQKFSDGKRWGEKEGKIYVGPNGLKLTGAKTGRSVGQADIINILAKADVKIPVKPKGISRTAMSIQHTTRDRIEGTVTSRTTDKDKLIKEIKIGGRTITFIADPESDTYELDLLKLNNIEDGEISFVDIGDTSTVAGREVAITTIADGINDMFVEMEDYLDDSPGSIGIADRCEIILDKIKDPALSKEEHQKLMLEMLALTKEALPDSEVNEFRDMSAYIAESLEAMRHLKNGRETLVPASGNFKTADVIPLIDGNPQPTLVTINGVQSELKGVKGIAGTSVKLSGGAPSSLPAKHKNTIYGKLDKPITVKGKITSDTKEVVSQVLSYYPDLFGVKGNKKKSIAAVPKVSMDPIPPGDYYESSSADLWDTFFEYYPELSGSGVQDDMMAYITGKVETQLARIEKSDPDRMEKAESKDAREQRMKLYHISQYIAGMISNHPEHGMRQQAFANSDYRAGKKDGKTVFTIKEADGIETLSYVGFAPDQGYTISADGHISPTNTYSSHLKHVNPALKVLAKYEKKSD